MLLVNQYALWQKYNRYSGVMGFNFVSTFSNKYKQQFYIYSFLYNILLPNKTSQKQQQPIAIKPKIL